MPEARFCLYAHRKTVENDIATCYNKNSYRFAGFFESGCIVRPREKSIEHQGHKLARTPIRRRGFTLIELLVVISIISLLMGILLPALGKVRRQAKTLMGMSNQRQIVLALNSFEVDNDDRYPESVAVVGVRGFWCIVRFGIFERLGPRLRGDDKVVLLSCGFG